MASQIKTSSKLFCNDTKRKDILASFLKTVRHIGVQVFTSYTFTTLSRYE